VSHSSHFPGPTIWHFHSRARWTPKGKCDIVHTVGGLGTQIKAKTAKSAGQGRALRIRKALDDFIVEEQLRRKYYVMYGDDFCSFCVLFLFDPRWADDTRRFDSNERRRVRRLEMQPLFLFQVGSLRPLSDPAFLLLTSCAARLASFSSNRPGSLLLGFFRPDPP
jgi:hypothetical protein